MLIKQGTTLILEHGEYSDYSFDGPFTVLKGFDQAAVSEEFKAQWKPQYGEDWEEPQEGEFIGWMIAQRYIEAMECHRWHIGSYRFSPSIQTEPASQPE